MICNLTKLTSRLSCAPSPSWSETEMFHSTSILDDDPFFRCMESCGMLPYYRYEPYGQYCRRADLPQGRLCFHFKDCGWVSRKRCPINEPYAALIKDFCYHGSMADTRRMLGMHQQMMGYQNVLHPRSNQLYFSGGRRHTDPNNLETSPFNMVDSMFHNNMLGGNLFDDITSGSTLLAQTTKTPGSSFHSSHTSIIYGDSSGLPKVYKSSSSTRIGRNGVKETKKTEENSVSGLRKMAVGHHIDDRSHVIEKSYNSKTGENEESQEFINIDEDEAEEFNEEFKQRLRTVAPTQPRHRSVLYHHVGQHSLHGHPRHEPATVEHHSDGVRTCRSRPHQFDPRDRRDFC